MESYDRDNGRFWISDLELGARGSTDATKLAAQHLKSLGKLKRVGVERAFLPADAEETLKRELPGVEIVEAWSPLERLRAVKTPKELELIREASERVVDSMLAVMTGHGPGSTKRQLVQALKEEEVKRGLAFEYCLITAGTSLNRAPSDQVWGEGDILSLDSGGNYGGYIGDLCRMAIQGEPDSELKDLLAEVDAIQMASRKPIRAGATGAAVYASAKEVLRKSANANSIEFVAHGMGLVTHEAPRLTYTRQDMDAPLEAGMILSIETTLHHPKRGFIKLEDTVAVTKDGWEAFGDKGRGWNRGRTA
jgi:Xaa-Pro aminopeptidase